MTEQEQKELGIFGLDWLGLEKLPNSDEWKFQFHSINWLLNPKNLFDDDFGPILAHLAKRKMEEMGFGMSWSHYTIEGELNHRFLLTNGLSDLAVEKYHENEYIALFFAIREAVKG